MPDIKCPDCGAVIFDLKTGCVMCGGSAKKRADRRKKNHGAPIWRQPGGQGDRFFDNPGKVIAAGEAVGIFAFVMRMLAALFRLLFSR